MIRLILLISFLILTTGCESARDVVVSGHNGLCDRQPDSMSCINHEDEGFMPSYSYLQNKEYILRNNFTYVTDKEKYNVSEYWFDNITIDKELSGDCDDISLTFASQLILDGVKPSSVRFVASGIDGKLKHYYIRVKLDSGEYFNFYKINEYTDIMYMQYDNIGVFIR